MSAIMIMIEGLAAIVPSEEGYGPCLLHTYYQCNLPWCVDIVVLDDWLQAACAAVHQ